MITIIILLLFSLQACALECQDGYVPNEDNSYCVPVDEGIETDSYEAGYPSDEIEDGPYCDDSDSYNG